MIEQNAKTFNKQHRQLIQHNKCGKLVNKQLKTKQLKEKSIFTNRITVLSKNRKLQTYFSLIDHNKVSNSPIHVHGHLMKTAVGG